MKVKQLIKTLNTLDPEAAVLVSSDAEGNSYKHVNDITSCKYKTDESYIDIYDIDNKIKGKKAIVIYPE